MSRPSIAALWSAGEMGSIKGRPDGRIVVRRKVASLEKCCGHSLYQARQNAYLMLEVMMR
ncbi:hypothetical protein BH10PSE12_BH10PSE12_07900 [soil metagenome]